MSQTSYYLYNLIETYFFKKTKGLQQYILRYLPSYFPDNIKLDGIEVIKADMTSFLFKTYEVLSNYLTNNAFSWNYNFNGFSNGNILILKENNDPYINEEFSIPYCFKNHSEWEREIINGKKHYLIGKKSVRQKFVRQKFSIQLLHLGFALQIFKLMIKDFNEVNLFLMFSSSSDIPSRIYYEGCDIIIYSFQNKERPATEGYEPQIRERKRADAVEFDWL